MLPDAKETFGNIGQQLTWKHVQFNMTQGEHTLKWVYSKDMSLSMGQDRAYLKEIVLAGAIDVKGGCGADASLFSPTCAKCPTGKYTNAYKAASCDSCDWFTFSNVSGASACQLCPSGTIAYPGSDSCQKLPNCTAADYVTLRSPISECTPSNGYTYTTTSYWRTVSINNNARLMCVPTAAVPLPPRQTAVAKCTCERGYYLNKASSPAACVPCAPGTVSDGNYSSTCTSCAVGSVAVRVRFNVSFAWSEMLVQALTDRQPKKNIIKKKVPAASRTEWSDATFVSCDTPASGTAGEFCSNCIGNDCIARACQKRLSGIILFLIYFSFSLIFLLLSLAGWTAGGKYLNTPRTLGNIDVLLGWRTLRVQGGSTLSITCSVDCTRPDAGQQAARDDCFLAFTLTNESGVAPDGFQVLPSAIIRHHPPSSF